MKTKTAMIRWLIRLDMPEVLDIERSSFDSPWTEQDFCNCLKQRGCTGMVAELGKDIAGYMVYELASKHHLRVINFAVDPYFRRMGVATTMVERLKQKLDFARRRFIELDLRESNLDAQLFFRSQGFRCVAIHRGLYEDTGEDAYEFRFELGDSE